MAANFSLPVDVQYLIDLCSFVKVAGPMYFAAKKRQIECLGIYLASCRFIYQSQQIQYSTSHSHNPLHQLVFSTVKPTLSASLSALLLPTITS